MDIVINFSFLAGLLMTVLFSFFLRESKIIRRNLMANGIMILGSTISYIITFSEMVLGVNILVIVTAQLIYNVNFIVKNKKKK